MSLLPGAVNSVCENDPNFTYPSNFDPGSPLKNCKNVRNHPERRASMCRIKAVNDACPQSCGVCCEDSATYEFKLKGNQNIVDCLWLTKNDKKVSIRRGKYCEIPLHNYNDRTVRDACPVSCDKCQELITAAPTNAPTGVTGSPTVSKSPTKLPTKEPSMKPSEQPTRPPSPQPSPFPTLRPSTSPSDSPSKAPSDQPSLMPSTEPSDQPSQFPSVEPSDQPSQLPSVEPSDSPSKVPSDQPSKFPSTEPSDQPSLMPSVDPSAVPSKLPSDQPSQQPSTDPSSEPSSSPTTSIKPSALPSAAPVGPTPAPTPVPTAAPTPLCEDSSTFTFTQNTNGNTLTCDWLTTHTDASTDDSRRNTYCVDTAVKTGCCASCTGFPQSP